MGEEKFPRPILLAGSPTFVAKILARITLLVSLLAGYFLTLTVLNTRVESCGESVLTVIVRVKTRLLRENVVSYN